MMNKPTNEQTDKWAIRQIMNKPNDEQSDK
jgi:hypothetical protein